MFETLISILPFSCHIVICACGGYLLWRCVSDIFEYNDNIVGENRVEIREEIREVEEIQPIEEIADIEFNEKNDPKLIIDKENESILREYPEKEGCNNAIITNYSNNIISFKEKKGKLFLYGIFQIKDDEKMYINWKQLYTKINKIKVIDVCSNKLYQKFLKYKEYDKVPIHHVKSFKNYF